MDKEVAVKEEGTRGITQFKRQMAGFTRLEWQYGCLRGMGYDHREAQEKLRDSEKVLNAFLVDPRWQALAERIVEKPEQYRRWGELLWEEEIEGLARLFVKEVLEQGLGALKKEEKDKDTLSMIRIAAGIANGVRKVGEGESGEKSYDEVILEEYHGKSLKVRRENVSVTEG